MTVRGMIAPFVRDGPIDRVAFETYVEKVLPPELRPGDIVIMDKLSSHKGVSLNRRTEAVDAEICFLPPYSPAGVTAPFHGARKSRANVRVLEQVPA